MLGRGILLGLALIALPQSTFAMQTSMWDFRDGKIPGEWEVRGEPQLEPGPDGLHIVTTDVTQFLHVPILEHPAQVISVTVDTNKDIDALIIWQNTRDENGQAVPIFFPAGAHTIHANMIDYASWSTQPFLFGIQLPAGANVQLADLQITSWSWVEQIREMWTSFFVTDQLLPYSINFLWGPVLARTPVGTDALFTTMPPRGWSLNRILLPAIALAAILLILLRFAGMKRQATVLGMRWHWGIFLLLFAGAWIFFDVRMGTELLGYVRQDYMQYILAPPENRTLRNYETIYAGILENARTLQQEPTYVFHAPPGTPFRALARYLTYPSLPIEQQDLTDDVRNWLIFERPDIEAGSTRQLMFQGRALTPPGDIVSRFGRHSLLFRTSAP